MKSNSKSAQKESWVDALYETIEDNVLATVLVLHEQFGFGEKRIEQYLDAFEKMADKLNAAAEDEIKDFKTGDYRIKYKQTIREILRVTTLNIMPERFYNEVFIKGHSTAKDVEMESARLKRRKEQMPLSFSEAAELQAEMQAFRDFLKDKGVNKDA